MEGIVMSKWRKPLKNQRRFDARYFLNERVESGEVVENSVQQDELKKNFHDFSFNSWLDEGADKRTPSGDVSEEDALEEGEETVIGAEDKKPEYGEELEEIVGPQGASPDSFPSSNIATMTPDQVSASKAKEREKELFKISIAKQKATNAAVGHLKPVDDTEG